MAPDPEVGIVKNVRNLARESTLRKGTGRICSPTIRTISCVARRADNANFDYIVIRW